MLWTAMISEGGEGGCLQVSVVYGWCLREKEEKVDGWGDGSRKSTPIQTMAEAYGAQ